MKRHFALFCVFILALALRLIFLGRFPAGFTADEAAQGYTAYSILKTGKDEWGVKFPLNPRSFGDFKAPVYTYLTIPSIAVFGLNEFAVRLPGAIFGSLSVLVVYFLVKELFVHESIRIKTRISPNTLPLAAAMLLAISPWHISLSRGAFEANLTTFFLPLGAFLFLKGLKSPKLLVLSAFFLGLNLFTYHSAKFVTPLVLIALIFVKRREFQREKLAKHIFIYVTSVIVFVAFGLLAGGSFLSGGGTRASDIGLFSGGWEAVSEQRYFAVTQGLPDIVSRIFNNKLTFAFSEFIKNYFSYLSPQFLFTQGAGEATYGMIPGQGLLYLIELPFLLASLYFLLKEKRPEILFLWVWVLFSPVPASLARGVGYHANRVAVMMPAVQILSAFGFVKLTDILGTETKAKLFFRFCLLFFCFSFLSFIHEYFFQAPRINAPKMSYGWRQVMSYLKEQNISRIIVSGSLSEPQAFVMFFGRHDPREVQEKTIDWLRYEKEGYFFVDQLGTYSLGRYQFRNFSFPEDFKERGVILVGSNDDYLIQERQIEERKKTGQIKSDYIISFPDGKVAFRMIEL